MNLSRRAVLQQGFGKQAEMATAVINAPLPDPPPLAVIALNRMGFGPRPGDVNAFNNLGATDEERLNTYIEQQLDPNTIDDSILENILANNNFTTLNETLSEAWSIHTADGVDYAFRTRPVLETEYAAFNRAIYSERQLVELLADFWHNHFNVFGWDYTIAPTFGSWDRDVIRTHLLGNFRDMLEAVAKHHAMLYYLDNYRNTRDGPNENWARELFELHALGAENYLGVMRQSEVPGYPDNPIGYVDDDVYEATRCFTGWTYDNDTREFVYMDDDHDRFQKTILGQFFPPDQAAQQDGLQVLDLVAYHPGTARYICRKLCRRFIADDPPETLVQSAAQVFIDNQQDPEQLKKVTRHILRALLTEEVWGKKVKRPFETVTSALRATNGTFIFRPDDDLIGSFRWYYGHTGQPLFQWRAPNGYPDKQQSWLSTTTLIMRWRLINWLIGRTDADDNYYIDIFGDTPDHIRSARQLSNHWAAYMTGYTINATTRRNMRDFMAQGINFDLPLDLDNDPALQQRLRGMVALGLMSPDFHWR